MAADIQGVTSQQVVETQTSREDRVRVVLPSDDGGSLARSFRASAVLTVATVLHSLYTDAQCYTDRLLPIATSRSCLQFDATVLNGLLRVVSARADTSFSKAEEACRHTSDARLPSAARPVAKLACAIATVLHGLSNATSATPLHRQCCTAGSRRFSTHIYLTVYQYHGSLAKFVTIGALSSIHLVGMM